MNTLYQLDKEKVLSKSFEFFHPTEDPPNDDEQLISLIYIDPNPQEFYKLIKHDRDIKKKYEKIPNLSYFNCFPTEYIDAFNDQTLHTNHEINYYSVINEKNGQFLNSTTEMFLRIPTSYVENDEKAYEQNEINEENTQILLGGKKKNQSPKIQNNENPENDEKSLINENMKISIENSFKNTSFGFDLMSNIINLFNDSFKTITIYSKKCDKTNPINYIQDNIIHSFCSEGLFIRKTATFINADKKNINDIKATYRQIINEFDIVRRLLLRVLIEIGSFQFRKDLEFVEFLEKEEFYAFLPSDVVNELNKDDLEKECDRDIRENWIDILYENVRQTIKKLGF